MKDYRLSEIKAICKKMQEEYGSNACDMCENTLYEVEQFCIHKIGDDCPCDWGNIEPRDMIELPYKEHIFREGGDFWVVYYRNAKYGCIDGKWFNTEAKADEFLANLKEKNNE